MHLSLSIQVHLLLVTTFISVSLIFYSSCLTNITVANHLHLMSLVSKARASLSRLVKSYSLLFPFKTRLRLLLPYKTVHFSCLASPSHLSHLFICSLYYKVLLKQIPPHTCQPIVKSHLIFCIPLGTLSFFYSSVFQNLNVVLIYNFKSDGVLHLSPLFCLSILIQGPLILMLVSKYLKTYQDVFYCHIGNFIFEISKILTDCHPSSNRHPKEVCLERGSGRRIESGSINWVIWNLIRALRFPVSAACISVSFHLYVNKKSNEAFVTDYTVTVPNHLHMCWNYSSGSSHLSNSVTALCFLLFHMFFFFFVLFRNFFFFHSQLKPSLHSILNLTSISPQSTSTSPKSTSTSIPSLLSFTLSFSDCELLLSFDFSKNKELIGDQIMLVSRFHIPHILINRNSTIIKTNYYFRSNKRSFNICAIFFMHSFFFKSVIRFFTDFCSNSIFSRIQLFVKFYFMQCIFQLQGSFQMNVSLNDNGEVYDLFCRNFHRTEWSSIILIFALTRLTASVRLRMERIYYFQKNKLLWQDEENEDSREETLKESHWMGSRCAKINSLRINRLKCERLDKKELKTKTLQTRRGRMKIAHIGLLLYYYNVNDSKKDKNKNNLVRGRVEIQKMPLNYFLKRNSYNFPALYLCDKFNEEGMFEMKQKKKRRGVIEKH
ncbi:hypothetical protein VP01_507g3 [Puccinia sorghi]|uniref:Uncharacterized protein n=1 Tax=Puccinia sorghi TaxID=27349 RepID=A0A0L6UM62_9BASI|nr:hypothetical protein VP01_507g3 [Puccinia sorghi]